MNCADYSVKDAIYLREVGIDEIVNLETYSDEVKLFGWYFVCEGIKKLNYLSFCENKLVVQRKIG